MVDTGRIVLPDGGVLTLDPRVDTFYTDSGARPIWLDEARIGSLLEAVRALPAEGLALSEARSRRLRWIGAAADSATVGAQARAELLASEVFLAAAGDVLRGAAEPREAGFEWRLPRDQPPGPEVLREVADGTAPSEVLDGRRPAVPHYDRLTDALQRYRAVVSGGGWPGVPEDLVLEPGDTAQGVVSVRERLATGVDTTEGQLAGARPASAAVYDDSLVTAVERFQRRHGLAVDGIVGPETVGALRVPAAERVETLVENLERLRWMPRDLGPRAILVNVAGFELVALEENRPALSMDVIVGRPEWRTRIFADSMTHLIFNPYWHVPESIEREEVLPSVLADPSYLSEQRFDVVREDAPFGAPVDPGRIDWSEMSAEDFPWDFRQRPGPENSLGRVKFMFPNQHAIYLHDTPADQLFDRSVRAFSHGCIRVERPWDLARWVVRNAADRPASSVARLRDAGERTRLDLHRPVHVYIVYFTAWVDDGGVVSFHPDIYERDEALGPVVGEG